MPIPGMPNQMDPEVIQSMIVTHVQSMPDAEFKEVAAMAFELIGNEITRRGLDHPGVATPDPATQDGAD
jgi:hypothetical protein